MKVTPSLAAEEVFENLMMMKAKRPGNPSNIRSILVKNLLKGAKRIINDDPLLLILEPPIHIIGALNGHFVDLLNIFETHGYPPQTKYLFLGNFIGRGPQNIETILLILSLKARYPRQLYIIRGSNEAESNAAKFKFKAEVLKRYDQDIWTQFIEVFDRIPLAATLSSEIFCVSSGISTRIRSIDEILTIDRPVDAASNPIANDFLSMVPDVEVNEYQRNFLNLQIFDKKAMIEFIEKNNLKLIISSRGRQPEGFSFSFGGDEHFLSISTVPGYSDTNELLGCILAIDESLQVTFLQTRPLDYIYRDYYLTAKEKKKEKEALNKILKSKERYL